MKNLVPKVTRGYVLAATLTEQTKTDKTPYPVYSSQTRDKGLMGYYKEYLYEDAITWTTDGANAGTVNYRAGKFYCTNVCGVLLSDKVAPNHMIAEALNNVAKEYVSYVGNPKLMNNVMGDIKIRIPSQLEERDLVSKFFSNLDNLITLHQRKLDKLKETKSAYLSEMFPKEGEFYPKRRFAGFTDPWEQRKVEDLGNIVTGSTPPTSDKANYGGDYLFVSPADIQENRYIKNTITKLSEQGFRKGRVLREGSTLFVSIGSTIGKVAQTRGLTTTNQQINAIEPTAEHDNDFIYSLMKYKASEIKLLAATQAVPILNKTSFSQVEVNIPLNIREQEKIGTFFSNLDNLITLHQRKLDKLQALKQAYLSEMFV